MCPVTPAFFSSSYSRAFHLGKAPGKDCYFLIGNLKKTAASRKVTCNKVIIMCYLCHYQNKLSNRNSHVSVSEKVKRQIITSPSFSSLLPHMCVGLCAMATAKIQITHLTPMESIFYWPQSWEQQGYGLWVQIQRRQRVQRKQNMPCSLRGCSRSSSPGSSWGEEKGGRYLFFFPFVRWGLGEYLLQEYSLWRLTCCIL